MPVTVSSVGKSIGKLWSKCYCSISLTSNVIEETVTTGDCQPASNSGLWWRRLSLVVKIRLPYLLNCLLKMLKSCEKYNETLKRVRLVAVVFGSCLDRQVTEVENCHSI